jgi:hypothetical protein
MQDYWILSRPHLHQTTYLFVVTDFMGIPEPNVRVACNDDKYPSPQNVFLCHLELAWSAGKRLPKLVRLFFLSKWSTAPWTPVIPQFSAEIVDFHQPVVGKKIVEVKPCFHSVLQLPGHKRIVVVLDVAD